LLYAGEQNQKRKFWKRNSELEECDE